MSNPSTYGPSSVLNAPALLYAGSGQPLTPYFVYVAPGATSSIPVSAITWSITSNGSGTASITVNGVTTSITGSVVFSGSGPLQYPITVTGGTDSVYIAYTLDNVIYNTPGYY